MKPLGREHTRRTVMALHERGIEMTPVEVDRLRKDAYAKIRAELKSRGHDVPDDDAELFLWMQAALMAGQGGD